MRSGVGRRYLRVSDNALRNLWHPADDSLAGRETPAKAQVGTMMRNSDPMPGLLSSSICPPFAPAAH